MVYLCNENQILYGFVINNGLPWEGMLYDLLRVSMACSKYTWTDSQKKGRGHRDTFPNFVRYVESDQNIIATMHVMDKRTYHSSSIALVVMDYFLLFQVSIIVDGHQSLQ